MIMRGALRGVALAGVALMLVVATNLLVARYIQSERYIYSWDWSGYWLMFQDLGAELRSNFAAALSGILEGVATNDYNALPILPLMPFEWVFGPSRLSYILAIANAAVLPSAVLLAWLVERAMGDRSWPRALLCTASVLGLHILWAPALRGFPDVVGVAVAGLILVVYFRDRPKTLSAWGLAQLAATGFLLSLLILTRRYYIFWAISFFPAAILSYLITLRWAELRPRELIAPAMRLAGVGIVCGASLWIFAAPLVRHMVATKYSSAYTAYRWELAGGGTFAQSVDHFGLLLILLCLAGLLWLSTREKTRRLGIFLIIQAACAMVLFARVQSLIWVQHFLLLAPAAGIGIAAAIAALYNVKLAIRWRVAGIFAVLSVVLLNSVAVLSGLQIVPDPLMARVRFQPNVRDDMGEVQRLVSTLGKLDASNIYVAASSWMFNPSILKTACRTTQPDLCAKIQDGAHVDLRDGFPAAFLSADYVVIAVPTQYHLWPQDQLVVGLVAQDIRQGRGIGEAFERLPGEFRLDGGVKVSIYQRVMPFEYGAVKALSTKLQNRYPQARSLFEPPPACPDDFPTADGNCVVYSF
jgi:hypothetical protein